VLRGAIERLSRNRVISRKLGNGASIFVSPDSALRYWKSLKNDPLGQLAADFVDEKSVVWDVGANCGTFAFSAVHAANVVAIEADPFLANLLQRTVLRNGWSNVELVCAAVSDSRGLAEFTIAHRGRSSNFLTKAVGRSQAGGSRAVLTVPMVTLDDLLDHRPAPTFIKIDVEGAEVDVLRGATRLLSEARPVFYIEVDAAQADACRAIFSSADYAIEGDYDWIARPSI
jgi:FkbM family methyltransferase